MNKKLIYLIIFLIPIAVFSFFKKETIFNMKTDSKIMINLSNNKKIELEEYIVGVVAAEMPASFDIEALKAQAIASRTFAINKIYNNKNYIFKTNTNDQAYITILEMKEKWKSDFEKYYNKIFEAVFETKNKIIVYQNKPIKAYYFAMSNGQTENAITVFNETEPYLVSVNSDLETSLNNLVKLKTFSKEEFCTQLNLNNCVTINISKILRSNTNRVEEIIINEHKFLGTKFRKMLQLRSTDFEISIIEDKIHITTKGYGHGVGMSQYGANLLASQGLNYEEIIKHYYQNTKINSINSL